MPGLLHNSLTFLLMAAHNVKTTGLDPGGSAHPEAFSSVIFAAAALEAFINERAEWAAQVCEFAPQPKVVVAFSNVMRDAEQSRASVQSKYHLARWVLCGTAYDQGSNPYQDFALLIDLRNSLLHLKPWPTVTKKLKGKGLLYAGDEQLDTIIGGWTILLQTTTIAQWACRSAAAFIAEFLDSIPNHDSIRTVLLTKDDYFGTTPELLKL